MWARNERKNQNKGFVILSPLVTFYKQYSTVIITAIGLSAVSDKQLTNVCVTMATKK